MATEDEVNFYSRPRVWGDQWATARNARFTNFYSRPREGGDVDQHEGCEVAAPISTHAPRGGRLLLYDTPPRGFLFLLASPRGGRPRAGAAGRSTYRFLLTPPRGGRLRGGEGAVQNGGISTHAPAWGATS